MTSTLRLAFIALSITPFLVGFSANDSTGWTVGAGASRSRSQYVTGCIPKYYSIRNTEFDAQVEYVRARNPKSSLSPAIQIQGAVGTLRNEKTLLAEERGGSLTNGIEDTLYRFSESEQITNSRNIVLLKLKGGLAWKYLELSAGVLASGNGYPILDFIGGAGIMPRINGVMMALPSWDRPS